FDLRSGLVKDISRGQEMLFLYSQSRKTRGILNPRTIRNFGFLTAGSTWGRHFLTGLLLSAAGGFSLPAVADVIIPDNYHYQVTQNFCAAASVEMVLDCPQVTLNNAMVASLVALPDGPTTAFIPPGTQPINEPTPTLGVNNGVGVVTSGPQAFIYGLNHGSNTVNGLGYLNSFAPFGVGTDSLGMVTALNLLDNSNVNAGTPNLPFGNDQYAGYNFAPTFVGA